MTLQKWIIQIIDMNYNLHKVHNPILDSEEIIYRCQFYTNPLKGNDFITKDSVVVARLTFFDIFERHK